jgi:hypothetical protein
MLRQTKKDHRNIQNCLTAFQEMRIILKGLLKNKLLIENQALAGGNLNF